MQQLRKARWVAANVWVVKFDLKCFDNKAATNLSKHGVDFREVMLDPLAMTFFDNEHSQDEDRWVSVGRSSAGALLLVVHTFVG
jgi:uncharacterized DUF497 family protein